MSWFGEDRFSAPDQMRRQILGISIALTSSSATASVYDQLANAPSRPMPVITST